MRARLLLLKQDRLVLLEKRLAQIDNGEPNLLSLACSRLDSNIERQSVLAEIESTLVSYGELSHTKQIWRSRRLIIMNLIEDELLENTHRVLNYSRPALVHSSSLRNWIDGGSGIFKGEVEFLRHHEDLITLSAPNDGVMSRFEHIATVFLSYLHKVGATLFVLG